MAKISLLKFRAIGYRSCRDAEISFSPNITALIGANGAGKTNLLQALMLFGQPGPGAGRTRSSGDTRAENCRVEVDFMRGKKLVQYRALVTYRGTQSNRDEVLFFKEEWNFTGKKSSRIGWISDDDGPRIPRERDGMLHFSIPARRRLAKSRVRVSHKTAVAQKQLAKDFAIATEVAIFASNMKYYAASEFTNPSISPTSFEVDEGGKLQQVGIRGSPHSRFIHELYSLSKADPETYDLFLSLVDKRGVGLVSGFTWRAVEFLSETHEVRSGGKVERKKKERILIIPTVKIGSSRLSFNQLSEGTFRTLALIFYIVSGRNSLIIIEEPEVCVHHGLLSSLIAIIKEYGRTKQIIFSTHSEAVIDNLQPEQLRLIEYSPRKGTTAQDISTALSKNRFAGLKHYLESTGNLGEFWRHGGF